MIPIFRRTPTETKASKKLKRSIRTHEKAQADEGPKGDRLSSLGKDRARLAEDRCREELDELEAKIESRRLEYYREGYFLEAKEKFPASVTTEDALPDLHAYRNSLPNDAEHDRARNYVGGLISAFDATRRAEERAVEDAAKRAIDTRNEIEWQACKKLERELNEQARPYFLQPRTLASRQHVKEEFEKRASEARTLAEGRGDDAVDTTGVRQNVLLKKYSEVFEGLAQRVSVFEYEIELQPSDDALQTKLGWLLDIDITENWVFRSATNKPSEEMAKLRVALLRYRQLKGLGTNDIPACPFPTNIPRSINANPAIIAGGELTRIPEQDRKEQVERKRLDDLDQLRLSDPKEWRKIDKELLKPIELNEIVAYWVECRTLDAPNAKDRIYWGDGTEAILGQTLHYDAPSKTFYIEDVDIRWVGPSERQQLSEAEEEIRNQKSVAGWMSEWNSHIIRKDTPSVPKQEAAKQNTPFCRRKVTILRADHMPDPKTDARHPRNGGQLRLGSFYTSEQCEAADKQMAKQGLRLFDGVSRPPEPVTIASKSDAPTRDSNVWFLHEQKIKQTGDDND